MGLVYQEQGQWRSAVESFNKIIRINRNEASAFIQIGEIMTKCGDLSHANSLYNRLIVLESKEIEHKRKRKRIQKKMEKNKISYYDDRNIF